MQAGDRGQIGPGKIVGDYRRPQCNWRAVAYAIGESKERLGDESGPHRPGQKQQAQCDMKGAQRLLASQSVSGMRQRELAAERIEAQNGCSGVRGRLATFDAGSDRLG